MFRIVFMSRLDYLLDFGLSLELLLGAMYRRRTIHPLDYIYAGLRDKAITKKQKFGFTAQTAGFYFLNSITYHQTELVLIL